MRSFYFSHTEKLYIFYYLLRADITCSVAVRAQSPSLQSTLICTEVGCPWCPCITISPQQCATNSDFLRGRQQFDGVEIAPSKRSVI